MPAVILGIDPGLQVTGYGVVGIEPAGLKVLEGGVIRSTVNGKKTTDLVIRLKSLFDGLTEVLEQFRPQSIAVEQLYAHYAHPRTAILMGHARGVLLLAAGQREIPVTSYSATRIKKTITGHGRASKEQVQYAM